MRKKLGLLAAVVAVGLVGAVLPGSPAQARGRDLWKGIKWVDNQPQIQFINEGGGEVTDWIYLELDNAGDGPCKAMNRAANSITIYTFDMSWGFAPTSGRPKRCHGDTGELVYSGGHTGGGGSW